MNWSLLFLAETTIVVSVSKGPIYNEPAFDSMARHRSHVNFNLIMDSNYIPY